MKNMICKPGEKLGALLANGLLLHLASAGLILLLAAIDFSTIRVLFLDERADIPAKTATLYSLTLALCLEGQPTFLGMEISRLTDKTRYRANDCLGALVGTAVASCGLVITFAVVIYLRWIAIGCNGGADAFQAGTYRGYYPVDLFLMWSPVLTSLLAFVISWYAFRSESRYGLKREMDREQKDYRAAEKRFCATLQQLRSARDMLWSLVSSRTAPPQTLDAFQQGCCSRIRNKIIENAYMAFPLMLSRFNGAVESELAAALQEMSTRSSIPLAISGIDLAQFLAEFDAAQGPQGAWDYETAQKQLMDSLKKRLDNGVTVAQSKVVGGTTRLEGEC